MIELIQVRFYQFHPHVCRCLFPLPVSLCLLPIPLLTPTPQRGSTHTQPATTTKYTNTTQTPQIRVSQIQITNHLPRGRRGWENLFSSSSAYKYKSVYECTCIRICVYIFSTTHPHPRSLPLTLLNLDAHPGHHAYSPNQTRLGVTPP